MDNNGWVLIHRKICDNELWQDKPFSKGQAWIDLFLNANHQEGSFWVRGNEVKLFRGQLGWSELTMAEKWGWSKNKVRRFLKWLETKQQIEQQKSSLTTIITILNYDSHQEMGRQTKQQTKQQKDSRKTADDTQTTNVTNETNETKPLVALPQDDVNTLFDFFYQNINPNINYGNKAERLAARWLIEHHGLDKMLKAARYVVSVKADRYAPTITTPYQLKEKMAALIKYKSSRNEEPKGIRL